MHLSVFRYKVHLNRSNFKIYNKIKFLLYQIYNILIHSPPKPHEFVRINMHSGLDFIRDQDPAISAIFIPRSWIMFGLLMGYYIVRYFPHDASWVPISDWVITPLCNLHSKLGWGAVLIAEKIQNTLNSPDIPRDELIAILGFLTEFIRWLRRLNFCFSIVLRRLNTIDHWGLDTYEYNHELCESTTRRLLEYYRTIERRLNISRLESALDG